MNLDAVPIIICEADEEIIDQTQKLLENDGFKNVQSYTDTKILLDYLSEDEKISAVIIIGMNAKFSIPSLETAQILKHNCPNVMIIGSGINSNNKFYISLMAIQNGCDSWVEKNKKNYTVDIIKKVNHWAKYIKEKDKFTELYTAGINGH